MVLKSLAVPVLIFILGLFFFSFKLVEVPRGITIDEAAFGLNASLISKTLRDENGRFLPVFVLSLEGRDWRQPVTQYFQVLTFKVFGRSLYNLKFTSVFVAVISAVLIFILGKYLVSLKFGLLALIIFITTPILIIHSHLALDNIMPIPFIFVWLLGLVIFEKKKSLKYLVMAGISLGISFYAHKSMRSAAPVWTLLTILYILLYHIKKWEILSLKNYGPILMFIVSIAPFFLISPILDYKYAGAVYGNQNLTNSSIYDFLYFYLSNFDLSFLFIKGDPILHHSTGKHGMFLLATLPLFIFGIYKSIVSGNKFLIFLAVCFICGPLFLGFIGSVHRASRMLFLVPIFTLISAYGFLEVLKFKKFLKLGAIFFILLFTINFFDFIYYYWYQYSNDTYHIFYSPVGMDAYKKLYEIAGKEKLKPLIDSSLLNTQGDGGTIEDFSRSLYFVKPEIWDKDNSLPDNSAVLTNDKLKDLKTINTGVNNYFIYVKGD